MAFRERRFHNEQEYSRRPIVVGAARSEHGTRLAYRVVCSKCQATDYVSKKIAQDKTPLCRSCAEKFLYAFEQGRNVLEQQVSCQCDQCNREFPLNVSVAQKKTEKLCPDCYRGFAVWRGKKNSKGKSVFTAVGTHVVRKVINGSV